MSYSVASERSDLDGLLQIVDGSSSGDTRGDSVPKLDEPNVLSMWLRPDKATIESFFEDSVIKTFFDAGTSMDQGSGDAYLAYMSEIASTQVISVIMGSSQTTFDVTDLFFPGTWTHLAIGFDPDDDTIRLWVAGVEIDPLTSVGSWSDEPTYNTNAVYFRDATASGPGPYGNIAEITWFRGYSMASATNSLSDFRELVTELAAGGSPLQGNWVRHWPLLDSPNALYNYFGTTFFPLGMAQSDEHPEVTPASTWINENACVGLDLVYTWAQAAKVRRVSRVIQTDSNARRGNGDTGHFRCSELFLTRLGGSAAKRFVGAGANNGVGLTDWGDNYNAVSHNITGGSLGTGSPLAALMPGGTGSALKYRYFDVGETGVTGNFGVGVAYSASDGPTEHDGFEDDDAFTFMVWLGHHDDAGEVKVGARMAGVPYSTVLGTQTITVDARDDEVVVHEFDIPASVGRNGIQTYCAQRNIADAVSGEVTIFGQSLESKSTTGVCESSWPNFAGDGVWDFYNFIEAWGVVPAGFQWDIIEYSSKRFDEGDDAGPVLFIINTGVNDRNYSNTSRDGVNASNTRAGHAADINAYIDLIRSLWEVSGRDVSRLVFGLCPTHRMSAINEAGDEDTTGAVRAMRAAQMDVAMARDDTFFLNSSVPNNQTLVTYDNQLDGGGDPHLNRTGYEAFWAITNNVIADAPAPAVINNVVRPNMGFITYYSFLGNTG